VFTLGPMAHATLVYMNQFMGVFQIHQSVGVSNFINLLECGVNKPSSMIINLKHKVDV